MAGVTLARVNFNAREIALSADWDRISHLLSREIQDELREVFSTVDATVGGLSGGEVPISGLTRAPSLTGSGTAHQMTIGPGRGFFHDATFPGLTSDDSNYLVIRWDTQVLTFTTPDGTNPRIDLIVASPAMVESEPQMRNTLLDPVTRSFTFVSVNKLASPVSTISVVAGTPGATPTPPAVPADKVALFEVFVPAGAANGAAFLPCRRLHRATPHPLSALSCVLSGCLLEWQPATDPATTSSGMSFAAGNHRIVIDGETIVLGSTALPQVFADTGNNPFGSAAAAGAGTPYYVYACGGRNLPQGARGYNSVGGTATGAFLPIVLVESLTAPAASGHPSGNITTPRGATTRGALYVGLGYVYRGTTNRQACIMTPEWTFGKRPIEVQSGIASPGNITLASLPAANARGKIRLTFTLLASGTGVVNLAVNPDTAGAPAGVEPGVATRTRYSTGASAPLGDVEVPHTATSTGVEIVDGNVATVDVYLKAVEHRVRRLRI